MSSPIDVVENSHKPEFIAMMTGRTRAPPQPVECEKEVVPAVEKAAPTAAVTINGDDEEDLKNAWKEFDHSLKGSVTASQFRQIMAGLGENVTDLEVEGIINSVDGDDKISCESFSVLCFRGIGRGRGRDAIEGCWKRETRGKREN